MFSTQDQLFLWKIINVKSIKNTVENSEKQVWIFSLVSNIFSGITQNVGLYILNFDFIIVIH